MDREIYVNVTGLGKVFPARAGDLADVLKQLGDGHRREVMVAALPRKVLDSPRGLGPVLGRLNDQLQAAPGFGLPRLAQHQLRGAEYADQLIIEIVRHAGSQLAEGREFFDLGVLLADAFLFINVS